MPDMTAFEAIITVLDETSKPIGAIMSKLDLLQVQAVKTEASLNFSAKLNDAGMLKNNAEMLGRTASEAERLPGAVDRAAESFGRLGMASGVLGGALVDMLPMLGGFAALGSGAGMMELVHSTAELSENLDVTSAKLGISTKELQRWDYIATASGIGPDAMNAGLEKLNKNLGAAAIGKDKSLVTLMHQLKINTKDANGHLLDASALLPKLADKLRDTKDAVMRAAIANVLFGKSGADMLPLLDQGSQKIDELNAAFNKYSYTFTPDDSKNLSAFGEAWKNLGAATSGLKDELGADLAPLFTPIVQGMANWTAANKGWIASDIAHGIKNTVTMLQEQSGEIAHAFDNIAASWSEQFGEIENAYDKFKNYLVPGSAVAGGGNLPAIAPKHSNLLLPPADARAGMSGHPYKAGPGWNIGPEPAPIIPRHSNLLLPLGDARAGMVFDPPSGQGNGPLRHEASLYDARSSLLDYDPDALGGSGGAAVPAKPAQVEVTVTMANVPAGSTVVAKGKGGTPPPKLNLGYSSMARGGR